MKPEITVITPKREDAIEFINEITGLPWYEHFLANDEETGMLVKLVRHPPGVVTPLHTHPCAHGNFVLKGTLKTNFGSFGAGTFVWFPEGCEMEHGAPDDEECVFLFITNKAFGIDFIEDNK